MTQRKFTPKSSEGIYDFVFVPEDKPHFAVEYADGSEAIFHRSNVKEYSLTHGELRTGSIPHLCCKVRIEFNDGEDLVVYVEPKTSDLCALLRLLEPVLDLNIEES